MRVHHPSSLADIFLAFLKLGVTSFGGPVAHLAFFREEFVGRRRWLDEETYADLVALCQFLPGPASSQVGMSLGILRGGLPGALVAWLGFTMPSAILLILFAAGVKAFEGWLHTGVLDGLKIAAVAVVAQALWSMARSLCPDRTRAAFALLTAIGLLLWPGSLMQVVFLVLAAFAGWALIRIEEASPAPPLHVPVSRNSAIAALVLFAGLLVVLPLLAGAGTSQALALFDSFYRTGALVFGGGHVVLPLLESELVPPGWISADSFLAGYGAAQAVPGPLFTFAAYLGAVMQPQLGGWLGGMLCLVAVFLPSLLLVIGVLPFWHRLRGNASVRKALAGVNAAVVGLLLVALYDPAWVSAVRSAQEFALALAAFLLLAVFRLSPWLVVLLSAAGGVLLRAL
ncbi:MAG: chromate efflux transporter [Burkholderiales bacterium]|nr:chromate efflux transporter [Burkholderiales bacterium]